jgi:cytoskeletal protein RodZ
MPAVVPPQRHYEEAVQARAKGRRRANKATLATSLLAGVGTLGIAGALAVQSGALASASATTSNGTSSGSSQATSSSQASTATTTPSVTSNSSSSSSSGSSTSSSSTAQATTGGS